MTVGRYWPPEWDVAYDREWVGTAVLNMAVGQTNRARYGVRGVAPVYVAISLWTVSRLLGVFIPELSQELLDRVSIRLVEITVPTRKRLPGTASCLEYLFLAYS